MQPRKPGLSSRFIWWFSHYIIKRQVPVVTHLGLTNSLASDLLVDRLVEARARYDDAIK